MNQDKFFIGGDWVDPAGTDTLDVISPAHRGGHRPVPEAHHRRHRPRRRRRPRGLRQRPVAADDAGRAGRRHRRRSPPASTARYDEFARTISERDRLALLVLDHGPGLRRHHGARLLRRPRPRLPVRGAPPGHARPGPRAPRAGRRRRRASSRGTCRCSSPSLKLGPALAVGLHRSCSSRRPRRRSTPTCSPRSSRRPACPPACVNIVAGRPRGRRAPRHATPTSTRSASPARRAAGRKIGAHLRRAAQALHPRARRQVGRDHPRRRRPRRRHPRPHARRAHEQRPGLRRADPHPRLARALRRGRRRAGRRRRRPMVVGDPLDPDTEIGPLVAERQRDRVEGYIAKGQDEGATRRHRRRPPGRPRQGLVRRADAVRRRRQHDDASPRRRSSARCSSVIPYDDDDDAVRHRQRLRLRPVRLGVDRRRRARASTSPAGSAPAPTASTASGMDFGSPVRRLQGLRHRPRARPRGPRGLPRGQDHRPAAGLRTCLSTRARACGSTSPTSRRRRARSRPTSTHPPSRVTARSSAAACLVAAWHAGTSTCSRRPGSGTTRWCGT